MTILQEIAEERNTNQPLTEQAYRNLLRDILTEKLAPGSKLTESKLSEAYRLSRTPVREALRRLENNGLVQFIPNRGFFVRGISAQEIEDMMKLRADGEIMAVRWGIERITEEEMEEFGEIFSHMEFYTRKEDLLKMIDINKAFHRMIYRSAHSNLLYNTMLTYQTYSDFCCPSNYFATGFLKHVLEEHRKIYTAYLEKNVEAGARAMRSHMNRTIHRSIF